MLTVVHRFMVSCGVFSLLNWKILRALKCMLPVPLIQESSRVGDMHLLMPFLIETMKQPG